MSLPTHEMFRRAGVAAGASALLCVISGCVQDRWVESHESGTRLSAARPECPQVWDTVPLIDTIGDRPQQYVVPARGLAVPGPITNIPEFHDCQRFIDSRGSAFEALYAVFASNRLDSIGEALRLDDVVWSSSNTGVVTVSATGVVTAVSAGSAKVSAVQQGQGVTVTTVGVVVTAQPSADTASTILVSSATGPSVQLQVAQTVSLVLAAGVPTTSALAIAQIYTFGNEGYDPLGIRPGFSCLYVFVDKTGALAARMVPVASGDVESSACRDAIKPDELGGTALSVLRTKPGNVSADYPPVARWDFDTQNQLYYIGIKCGDAWCEIGAAGGRALTPSASFAYNPSASDGENRVLRVKGWHDQQNLAIDVPSTGTAVPSGILGTVVPHPELGSYTAARYEKGNWVLSGYVGMDTTNAIQDAVKTYKKKFNFDPVPVALPLSSMNTLSFCYGKRDECAIPEPPAGRGCNDKSFFFWYSRVWWVKIEAAIDHSVMYRCVTRRGHSGMSGADQIAPTARWRWVAEDETVWEYCMSHACCEVGANSFSEGWFSGGT